MSHAPSSAPPAAPVQPVPFVDLQAQRRRLGGGIEAAIARVLDHGAFINGPEVAELEQRLAAYVGVRHAIGCASGTDALQLVLMAWGVGRGDAVFVPAFTFAATAEAAALVGATPVFVDVRAHDFNLDPASLAAAVPSAERAGLRPRAVIPVDLFGHPADYPAIDAIAERHGLLVLADAAQSFGGSLNGRRCGAFGDAAATSFYPAKPLGAYGDAGAVFTDDDALAATVLSLRVHGQGRGGQYDNVRVGITGRLDTLQAAILLVKLAAFPDELAARNAVARRYGGALAGVAGLPTVAAGATSAWAQYTLLVDGRDALRETLSRDGIPTAVYYPRALSDQPAFAACATAPDGTPVARRCAERVVSLPIHPDLEPAVQRRICAAVRSALGG